MDDEIGRRQDQENWAQELLGRHNAARFCETHEIWSDAADPGALEETIEAARKQPYDGSSPDESEVIVRGAYSRLPDNCPGYHPR